MLIKKEFFTSENGTKMLREYYGGSEENITAIIESSAEEATEAVNEDTNEEPEAEEKVTQNKIFAQILLNQAELLVLLKANAGGNADV